MAEFFPAVPGMITFTTGGANVATQLNMPNNTRRLTLFFVTDPGKVATAGTDGGAIDAAHATVEADRYFAIFVDRDPQEGGKGPASAFIATAAGGTTVRAICEAG